MTAWDPRRLSDAPEAAPDISAAIHLNATATDTVATALAILGGRWTYRIVAALLAGPHTFGELKSALAGVSANVLTQRLRRLSGDQVLKLRAADGGRARYELTGWGKELFAFDAAMRQWLARRPPSEETTVVVDIPPTTYCPHSGPIRNRR